MGIFDHWTKQQTAVKYPKQQLSMILFVVAIFCSVSYICSACDLTLQSQYVAQGAGVTIQFTVDVSSLPPNYGLVVVLNRNITLINIYGTVVDDSVSDVTFTGDAGAGDISFTVSNIGPARGGVYSVAVLNTPDNLLQCQTVYVLGKPTVKLLMIGTDPESGDSAKFECSGTSTTVPSDHSLGMNYSWTFDNKAAVGSRFQITENMMTISNISKEDQNKIVTCRANENVIDGLTSNSSEQLTINVAFGPDIITFDPPATSYTNEVNESLPDISCGAVCNPLCNYTWKKDGTNIAGQTGETLSLGNLDSMEAGIYTCTATRGVRSLSKDLTVTVIYGPGNIIISPGTSYYRQDELSSLGPINCTSDCWPCEYRWTGPRSLLTGAQLLIQSLKRDQDGVYTCTATNTQLMSTATTTISVNVKYGPDLVSLDPSRTTYVINEGGEVADINCTATCFPSCTYVWRKDVTHLVSNNQILRLGKNISRHDSGVYTCTASNPDKSGTKLVDISLKVRYGPDSVSLKPTADNNYTRNEGTVLHDIICSSECYPNCTYAWEKQGHPRSPFSDSNSLSLGNLTQQERGVYVCKATNPKTSDSRSYQVTINVRYGPDKIRLEPNIISRSVTEGHILPTVMCSADCWPGCEQFWTNVTSDTVIEWRGTLSLGTTSRYNTGEYSCTSSNQSPTFTKSREKSIDVTVMYFPDVSVIQETDHNATEHDASLSLLCSAKGEPNQYTFSKWIHVAPDLQTHIREYPGETNGNQSRIILQDLSYMDAGVYTCTVSNGVTDYKTGETNATKDLILTVKGSPKLFQNDSQIYGADGGSVSLDITFYSNDGSEPIIKWYMIVSTTSTEIPVVNGTEKYMYQTTATEVDVMFYTKRISQPGYYTRLLIASIQSEDFTTFILRINNSVGYNETRFIVSPRGPPGVPTLFQVLPESEKTSSITFSWYPGFHNGADQIFYIQYRIKETSEWIPGTSVFGGKNGTTQQFNTIVTGLFQDTRYEFTIHSNNTFGNSDYNTIDGNTTAELINEPEDTGSLIWKVVVGTLAVVVILGIVFAVVFVKRRTMRDKNKDITEKTNGKNDRQQLATNDDTEINLNPMYESAGPMPSSSNNNDIYAKVNNSKPLATSKDNVDLYSVVLNKKDRPKEKKDAVPSDLYSMPVKPGGKGKKEKKQQKKKNTKQQPNKDGLVYENSNDFKTKAQKDLDNVYENPSCSTVDEEAKPKTINRTKNQDGLIYLEVEIPPKSESKSQTTIIHGLEDRNDYADIVFGKVGEQAPESDEEDAAKK